MSEEQLKAFWEAIQADTALQQKLQGVTDPDAVAVIAKEAGFSISADDLKKAMESVVSSLSDEQLEGVTGGMVLPIRPDDMLNILNYAGNQSNKLREQSRRGED